MTPLAITLAGIGVFTVICAGFTVGIGAVDHLVVAVRRRSGDPLRPDRDREQLRRALARTRPPLTCGAAAPTIEGDHPMPAGSAGRATTTKPSGDQP